MAGSGCARHDLSYLQCLAIFKGRWRALRNYGQIRAEQSKCYAFRKTHVITAPQRRFGAESLFTIWPHWTIGPALRADYRDVSGCEPPDGEKETMIIITSAQALGILYVLEGSAFGARILTPRASALGMSANFGANYLSLQVSTPGAWKMFLAVLEAAEFDRTQEEVCIEEAMDTFARFERAYAAATTAFA